ncbi:uncharacterized protein K452DRAFT_306807 [Aplosporella prunicola CBS 121167]|uniref:PH domain-containing protein n=1 Tax=Aplosporella prunicola CBS 121167 TaxID=1176127 RepID=A0A6A6BJ62_9PEZI|nr:uncharacterized protein K452DRAFT_306807 [Aplosporella prunicola CBS 121167]KAF2144200.1 hypothetical protein K452DRAFT_306807 [Aplosporella prunicola CBS 121167]
MVNSAADPPKVVATDTDNTDADPFVASPAHSQNSHNSADANRRRYAGFDNQLFSIYSESSPSQTKRALEAHLAETERRLQDASQLGTVLVQQREELGERLKEVERQQDATEIGPELRAKLVELEREFNEVGKDTARAFIPKSRTPSSTNNNNQFVDSEGNSIFASEAQPSPSKLSVPSRKQRNQQPTRIHDIKLATEISSSLLNQVRELQVALAEKDELLRNVSSERSQLEVEVEGLTHRLRALDESEQRYKDENWSLETRIQELMATLKEASNKEHRLTGNLNTSKSEKAALERELEELRHAHSKLNEEYQSTLRQYEAEILGLRRNVSSGEAERSALLRKVDELTSQNEELVRAVAYRQRAEESNSSHSGLDGDDTGSGRGTPDLSPPPSPSRFTPRHGQLETETLKSSLQHAHRMIQNLKNNIHREKTEKMELRRVLQDTKDELDIARREAGGAPGSAAKKRRPNEKQELFKKPPPRPDRLGMARGTRDEIIVDDGEWEDNDEHDVPNTPSKKPVASIGGVGLSPFGRRISRSQHSNSDLFQSATESSDVFETANERDTSTETDAFQTGAETLDGDDTDEMTETEIETLANSARRRRPNRADQSRAAVHRNSYLSTASTSGDEIDQSDVDITTPKKTEQSRYRLKVNRGGRRVVSSAAQSINENAPAGSKSPSQSFISTASFRSDGSQYEGDGGKSLLAELGNMSGEESEIIESDPGTPGSSMVSPKGSPDLRRHIASRTISRKASSARPHMVDSSTNTEPWDSSSKGIVSSTAAALGAAIAGFATGSERAGDETPTDSRQLEPSAFDDDAASDDSQETTIDTAAPSGESVAAAAAVADDIAAPTAAHLEFSTVDAQQIEPLEPEVKVAAPPTLDVSAISSLGSEPEPLELATPVVPKLEISTVSSQQSEPVAPEAPVVPKLQISSVSSLQSEPIAPAAPAVPKLEISSVSSQQSEPIAPKAPVMPKLRISSVSSLHSEPIAPAAPAVPSLDLSSISSLHSEPEALELQATPQAPLPALELSSISSVHAEEPALPSPPATKVVEPQPHNFELSSISALHTEPIASELPAPREVKPELPNSQLSSIVSLQSDPVAAEPPAAPKIELPSLELSSISALHSEPVVPEPIPSALSPVFGQEIEPEALELSKPTPSTLSPVFGQQIEPVAPEAPRPTPSALSPVFGQQIEPVAPEAPKPAPSALSPVFGQEIEPEAPEAPKPTPSALSPVFGQAVEPVSLPLPEAFTKQTPTIVEPTPALSYAGISSQHIEPEDAIAAAGTAAVLSKDAWSGAEAERSALPGTDGSRPGSSFFSSVQIEDAGADQQSRRLNVDPQAARPDSETIPENNMASIASNVAPDDHVVKSRKSVSEHGTQTMVSSEVLDKLFKASQEQAIAASAVRPTSPTRPPSTSDSKESKMPKRPTSAQSMRSRETPPPLPADHREVIAAASLRGHNSTGKKPASSYSTYKSQNSSHASQFRPLTPNGDRPTTPQAHRDGTTPRPLRTKSSEISSPVSRRTSVSSFASEMESRFNIPMNPVAREGFDHTTDPRMIQAITQTMIGEYLWKYTRKTGREEMSENRHRRFFWVHPYTRTLYWSDQDPATAGKTQLKAKSVQIEDVRVETDDNPLPPGLHRKSLIVITPGRAVKFTATTAQRHETWFNALSYLLLRTSQERDDEDREAPPEDSQEFDPAYTGPRSTSRQTARSRQSLSSYNSRTTRTSSPYRTQVPTLVQRKNGVVKRAVTPGSASMSGRLSSLSGMFLPANLRGSFSSRQSRHEGSIYDASIVHDSAEDLRQVIQSQEESADRLENVRACCDGKHDVGSLSHKPKPINSPHTYHSHSHNHNHNHNRRSSHARASSYGTSTVLSHQSSHHSHQTDMEPSNSSAN